MTNDSLLTGLFKQYHTRASSAPFLSLSKRGKEIKRKLEKIDVVFSFRHKKERHQDL
jgi:hypothetical protein